MSEKWWDMSDDELDDLFREASDKVDVPFESSAYNKLRQKIAEQPVSESPKGFKKRWLLLLLSGLFLMVGVGLVYRFGNKDEGLTINAKQDKSTEIVGKIEPKNTMKPSNVPSSVQSEIIKKEDSELLKSESSTNKEIVSSVQKESIVEKSKPPLSVISQTKTRENSEQTFVKKEGVKKTNSQRLDAKTVNSQTVHNSEKSPLRTIEILHSTKNEGKVERSDVRAETKNLLPQATAQSNNLIEKENSIKTIENVYYNSKNTENQLVTKNNSKIRKGKNNKNFASNPVIIDQNSLPIIENSSIIQEKIISEETVNKTNFYDVDFMKNKGSKLLSTDIHTELPFYIDSLPRTVKSIKYARFGVRLAIAPDINFTENINSLPLGSSFGILLEYRLTKKLILQSGVSFSTKQYHGSFDDYHNYSTTWSKYFSSKPTDVVGKCTIIDIPVNLRLNVFQKPRQTIFISAGISSYIMPTENYTYNFSWGSPTTLDWNDNTKYNWSVFNLSVGIEKQFTKNLSFQIEPYLKSPINALGRGGLNLYSSGLLFSTKYEF